MTNGQVRGTGRPATRSSVAKAKRVASPGRILLPFAVASLGNSWPPPRFPRPSLRTCGPAPCPLRTIRACLRHCAAKARIRTIILLPVHRFFNRIRRSFLILRQRKPNIGVIKDATTMQIWNNFILALSRYNNFSDRSRRAEFWGFWIVSMLFVMVAKRWDHLLFDNSDFFRSMVNLIFLVPSLAVGARRLHDTGRSGWWQLIALTGIGYLVLMYWWAKDSDVQFNAYGDSPKYPAHASDSQGYTDDQLV